MYSQHRRKARLLFGVSDVILATLAFEAAYQTRLWLPLERYFEIPAPNKALLLGFSLLTWVVLGYWLSIYERLDSAHPMVILRDATRQCGFGLIAVILFEFSLRLDLSRVFLGLFGLYTWLLLVAFRWKIGKIIGLVRKEFAAPHYVLIVGLTDRAHRLGQLIERSQDYGFRLLAFLATAGEDCPERVQLNAPYPVYPISELPRILREYVVDEILFAVDSDRLASLEDAFLLCDEEGVRTRVAVDFFPHVNSDIYLDRLGEAPLLTFVAAPHDDLRLLVKRLTDIVIASAALVLLSPLMLVIALLIKLTSSGPAIFKQVRCGLNGRRFVFYKFRSMVANAEELKSRFAHLNEKEVAFKIANDPRMTPLGRWLRKFSIDEWPQLWNVLRGDMSLVGPRPAVPEEVERYERWQRRRLRMRPGLTCLWAVSGRDRLDFETWMKLDMQYIDNWSLSLDWKILIRTIPQVLLGKGAH
ncbi:MAG: sugar transferase [Bryobacteraceae bacterium]|nr:sugar transferase [Bryobacteraceae bacterium]MDW8377230.1 sugar transferase [Bryobacterales bacterium]